MTHGHQPARRARRGQAVFARYEDALVHNKVEVLDELFWDSPHHAALRRGENLYGIEAIQAFRAARPATGLARELIRNHRHHHLRPRLRDRHDRVPARGQHRIGRQSQTWMRTADGWRVVAAHVSLLGQRASADLTTASVS
jgi:hypothetical protein